MEYFPSKSRMSEKMTQKNGQKVDSYRSAAWFRVLLWWGTEIARQVFVYRKPQAQIVHISKSAMDFPLSSWAFTQEKSYCLTSESQIHKIEIHPVSGIKPN
jgi:hypothetical protein